jgi:hypothetical protein
MLYSLENKEDTHAHLHALKKLMQPQETHQNSFPVFIREELDFGIFLLPVNKK